MKTTRRFGCQKGFSLVELLASMSVLLVLTLIIVQLINSSTKATKFSTDKQDSLDQARLSLDLIGVDLASRIKRDELPMDFIKGGGNTSDQLGFYSQVAAYGSPAPTRRITTVGYRIQKASGGSLRLERGGLGSNWLGSSLLKFQPTSFPLIQDPDYQVLADGVIRFEICFLRKSTGTLVVTAPDEEDLGAIVVGLAVMDGNSRKLFTPEQIDDLAGSLQDAEDDSTPLELWKKNLESPSFGAGMPGVARQVVRIYQRYFYVL
jgi:prepilin-type N-terminal cleavage/methylation domain-containing protein